MKRKVLLIALTIFLNLSMCACTLEPTAPEATEPTEPAAS